MFEIEVSEPRYSKCGCCGGRLTNVTRFVSRDGEVWALYHATFGDSHPEKGVFLAIGVDDVANTPEWIGRTAFAIWLSVSGGEYRMTVTNREESPWSNSNMLGKMLDREDALVNPNLPEVFHLIDHIVFADPAIEELFETVH